MTETGLLTLVQWLSPAFPVGSFAYSHGLEWAIAAGEVVSADAARDWIATILAEGAGRTDAILLAAALDPGSDPVALGALAEALAASRERWIETMEQGRALALTVSALTGRDIPPLPYPVALGLAARGLGVAPEQVAALYLQAFATTLTLAAVRFVPLGQTEGQRILAELQPLVRRIAAEAVRAGIDDIGSGAIRGDLAAMRHETMDVRIFRT
jgi:urease accessory protein